MVEDGGGRKFTDAVKIFIVQIVGGIKAAAGEERVLDAGRQEVAETHFQVEVVQFLQKTALGVVGKVGQKFGVHFLYRVFCLFHQRLPDVLAFRFSVPLHERIQDGGVVFVFQFPQIGHPRAPHRAGVRHIENIGQARVDAVLIDERNALGAGLDPAAHILIPQFHAGAGGGVRALGVD